MLQTARKGGSEYLVSRLKLLTYKDLNLLTEAADRLRKILSREP